jgi:hypothetical protein
MLHDAIMLIWIGLLYLTGQVLSEPGMKKNSSIVSTECTKSIKEDHYTMYTYAADVHLSLGGTRVANNSHIDIDSIGTSGSDTDALLCHTGSLEGDWYDHNETVVADTARLNDTVIKLFPNNASKIEGQFYCLVNSTKFEEIAVYINIGKS